VVNVSILEISFTTIFLAINCKTLLLNTEGCVLINSSGFTDSISFCVYVSVMVVDLFVFSVTEVFVTVSTTSTFF
jgi:hypothetical protein